jgi:hypothetical protein
LVARGTRSAACSSFALIYHFSGNKAYGKTKTGAYMCEQDATSQGIWAAKNEKHP